MTCVTCGASVAGAHLVAITEETPAVVCSVACAHRVRGSIEAWLWRRPRRTLRLVSGDDKGWAEAVYCDACGAEYTYRPDHDLPPPWRRFLIVGMVGPFYACNGEHEALVRRRYERPERAPE